MIAQGDDGLDSGDIEAFILELDAAIDNKVDVHIIRAFEGPRHDRLAAIWDCVAEYCKESIRLRIFANPGAKLSHAECLQAQWDAIKNEPGVSLFTEFDFLPDLRLDGGRGWLLGKFARTPCVAAGYYTRNPRTMALCEHGSRAGGWYVRIERDLVQSELTFAGKPDPANQLPVQIPTLLLAGSDEFPVHYGVRYAPGTHLFWSRHLHDDPNLVVAGCKLADVQSAHDFAVDLWIRCQPKAFRELLTKRGVPLSCSRAA